MSYHQLQLTLHSDHALVQRETIRLASFLNVPWRALRNQLGEWDNPKRMRHDTTVASRAALPRPYTSHQVGIYVLDDVLFAPDSLKRPLATCQHAKFLHDRLAPSADFTPTRHHLSDVMQETMRGIDSMIQASRQALQRRGYSANYESLSMQFLPDISMVVYTADAVEPHYHSGFGRRGRFPAIFIPMTLPIMVRALRYPVQPTFDSYLPSVGTV